MSTTSQQDEFEVARIGIEERLIRRAQEDAEFRRQLEENPKAAIARETGVFLSNDIDVEVHIETPNKLHLVVPVPMEFERELGPEELSLIAGGLAISPPAPQKVAIPSESSK